MKSWIRDHPIVASAVGTLVAIWAVGLAVAAPTVVAGRPRPVMAGASP